MPEPDALRVDWDPGSFVGLMREALAAYDRQRADARLRELKAFRAETLEQAPRDLDALGVPTAYTRWGNAVNELHRLETLSEAYAELAAEFAGLQVLALRSWQRRGQPYQPWRSLDGCAAIGADLELVDLTEAELQAGCTLKSLHARRAHLDQCSKLGRWPRPLQESTVASSDQKGRP